MRKNGVFEWAQVVAADLVVRKIARFEGVGLTPSNVAKCGEVRRTVATCGHWLLTTDCGYDEDRKKIILVTVTFRWLPLVTGGMCRTILVLTHDG